MPPLLLLQEHVDALPEDLAEMLTAHGRPMTAPETEHLSLHLDGVRRPITGYLQQAYSHLDCTVEVKRLLEVLSLSALPEPSIYTVA